MSRIRLDPLSSTGASIVPPIAPVITGGTSSSGSDSTPDATTLIKGKVQLAGDLDGTAALPLVRSRTFTVTVGLPGMACDYIVDPDDASDVINQAIQDMSDAGGGTVFVRAGTYSCAGSIIPKNYVHLRGESEYTTIFEATVGGLYASALISTIFEGITAADPLDKVILSDFTIDCSNFPRNIGNRDFRKGIYIIYMRDCEIRNVYCLNSTATGIGADMFERVLVDHCTALNSGTSAYFAQGLLTSDGTNVSAGDTVSIGYKYAQTTVTADGTVIENGATVTLGGVVYTFRNTLSSAYDVKIDSTSAYNTLNNFKKAVAKTSGYEGTAYGTGTVANPYVTIQSLVNDASSFKVVAKYNGIAGNSLTISTTSTHLTIGVATLSGGTSITYTFVSSPSVAYDVKIGTNADDSLANLMAAINTDAGAGTLYGTGTVANPKVYGVSVASHVLTLGSIDNSNSANTISLLETSAHLSFSLDHMDGGTGQFFGHNGIGIASGGMDVESVIVTNCFVENSAHNDYTIEMDESNTGPDCVYIFSNNVSNLSRGSGFRNSGTNNVTFNDNACYGAADYAFITTVNGEAHQAINTSTTNNLAVGAGLYGIYQYDLCDEFTISGNTVKDCGTVGMYAMASGGTISDNKIIGSGDDGIRIGSPSGHDAIAVSDLVISGNVIKNNGKLVANCDGINFIDTYTPIQNVLISNNRCFDNQTDKTQRYGLSLSSGASGMSGITIADNNFAGNATGAFNNAATITGLSVTNNVGVNPDCVYDLGTVSGTITLNVANGTVQTVTVSGSITLAISQPEFVGQEMTVVFTQDGTGGHTTLNEGSHVDFTDGKGLLSPAPGAVNIFSFVYDGANWKETSRGTPQSRVVRSSSANTALANTDDVLLITAASKTVTLPDAITTSRKIYRIKNMSTGTMTLATTSSQTIDGAAPGTIPAKASVNVISDGANWVITSPGTIDLAGGISGTLSVANGGTGITSLGTGVATFLGTPSSANLASALTDETGSGAAVFATSPTLVTPALGTPTSGVATNLTGTAAGLTAGNVTTNANLTGPITSSGNATGIASQTGTGTKFVVDTSPTIVTPNITQINDANGNLYLGVTATASAVNGLNITNAISSGTVTLAVSGSGTNSPLLIKGQGGGLITSRPGSNSINAIAWQNAAGGSYVLSADTTNIRLAVGGTTPTSTLDVRGATTIAGNLTLNTAGNKLNITTGSNASAGTGTLTAGTVTISTTAVTANSLIFLTDTASTLTNVGILSVTAKSAGTSFTVTSSVALDTSTFNWLIIN